MSMNNWQSFIEQQKELPYFQKIITHIEQRKSQGISIYPEQNDVFSAFDLTPLDKTKIVIIGQDPYHGEGQAHGLAFSVKPGIKVPPSLVNMYKELATDIDGFITPNHGYLINWAQQGVLMLNTVLTVEQSDAHSHAKIGWNNFTDAAIKLINDECKGVVFLLWGSHAQQKGKMLDGDKHLILNAVHPSPLSAYRGFFGCQHFSKANAYLKKQGKAEIDWRLADIDIEQNQYSLL